MTGSKVVDVKVSCSKVKGKLGMRVRGRGVRQDEGNEMMIRIRAITL